MIDSVQAVPVWAAIPAIIFLLAGSCFVLIGALGLLRLPNFFQRIHGPPITISVGTGCLLIASIAYFSGLQSRPVFHELLITAFILLTAPVTSMLIMRAAVYRRLRKAKGDALPHEGDTYRFPRER